MFRVVMVGCLGLPILGCSGNANSNTMNVDENLTATAINSETNAASATPLKTHLYAINDGNKYGYVAAVSEDERKRGTVAGDVVLFSYRGRDGETYKIDEVSASGAVVADYECTQPCAAIKAYTYAGVKYMGFEPTSLIGEAFTDAFNGFLNPARLPGPTRTSTATQPYLTSPTFSSPPADVPSNYDNSTDAPSPPTAGENEK